LYHGYFSGKINTQHEIYVDTQKAQIFLSEAIYQLLGILIYV